MRFLSCAVVSVVTVLWFASPALAVWGVSEWGTMVWGAAPVGVPTLGLLGLGLLSLALIAGAALSLRRRAWTMSVLLVALAIPLAAVASPITGLNTFSNGTTADANEVNANFDAVEAAVNDNDSRITAVDNDAAAAQATADTAVTGAAAAQAIADAAQVRVGATCAAGSSIRAIAAGGTVTCEVDTDTNTTYSAGSGLGLSGTTFLVNPTQVQSRVTGECPAGESIRRIKQGGTVICETDTDTQLSEAEVDAFVADNGYGLATDVAANAAEIAALGAGGIKANCGVKNTVQQILVSPEALTFNTSEWCSPSSMWNSGDPTKLVAPVAGVYLVQSHINFSSPNGTQYQMALKVNGVNRAYSYHTPMGVGMYDSEHMSLLYHFNANDYVQFYWMYPDSQTVDAGSRYAHMSMSLIAED